MTIIERAKALDAAIEAAGGLAEYWKATAPSKYTRLVDPITNEVIADRGERGEDGR